MIAPHLVQALEFGVQGLKLRAEGLDLFRV
jgi:hypothetical protein